MSLFSQQKLLVLATTILFASSSYGSESRSERLWLPTSSAHLRPFLQMAVNLAMEEEGCNDVLYARLNEYRTIYAHSRQRSRPCAINYCHPPLPLAAMAQRRQHPRLRQVSGQTKTLTISPWTSSAKRPRPAPLALPQRNKLKHPAPSSPFYTLP